jgi:hypothetical protein
MVIDSLRVGIIGLVLAAGAASAGPEPTPQAERGVVRTVQFFPANLSLGTVERDAIAKTGRTLLSPRHAGCKAPCLRLDPGTRITVVGHAFYPRKEEDVTMVSQMRAGLVRQVLIDAGVPADRIWMAACGDSTPAIAGRNDERVEIILAPDTRDIDCG